MTPRGSDRFGTIGAVTAELHVHRFGPAAPIRMLAIHGLTGHGKRWQTLACAHLPDVAIAAPDLLGHGRSSWAAPWTLDANAAALAELLESDGDGPVLVVGHSFGGAVALRLAAVRPDLVAGLVLLDPAVGLNGERMRDLADAMLESPDYTDRNEARDDKRHGSWGDVDPAELEAELDEHLVQWPGGRWGWRMSLPAMMSYWSELARPMALPAKGTGTTLVRSARTDPPYASDRMIDTLRDHLGGDLRHVDFECDHMVAQACPAETAAVIRERLP